MQQTIIYLENLCQTLTAQTASARQDAEIQTQVREVMFRELKGEIKDFREENEKLKAENRNLKEDIRDAEYVVDRMKEKNEKLKAENRTLKAQLDTAKGPSSTPRRASELDSIPEISQI